MVRGVRVLLYPKPLIGRRGTRTQNSTTTLLPHPPVRVLAPYLTHSPRTRAGRFAFGAAPLEEFSPRAAGPFLRCPGGPRDRAWSVPHPYDPPEPAPEPARGHRAGPRGAIA